MHWLLYREGLSYCRILATFESDGRWTLLADGFDNRIGIIKRLRLTSAQGCRYHHFRPHGPPRAWSRSPERWLPQAQL